MVSDESTPSVITGTLPYLATTTDDGAVANTSGSIESRVRANPNAGFSIVAYTGYTSSGGTTLGHGLNAVPKMVHIKRRSSAYNWISILTDSSGQKKSGYLDLPNALSNDSSLWDSNIITLSSSPGVTANGADFVAYCWAEIPGYSAFGSYVGTGSTSNTPFVYTGFRPRWILCKQATGVDRYWQIHDSARNEYNETNIALYPDQDFLESVTGSYDFLSNGFKLRSSASTTLNGSGETYVYAAFAEHPFRSSRAR